MSNSPPHGSVPELMLVMTMCAITAVLAFMEWRLARLEAAAGSDDFRFDVHRTICCGAMFLCAASGASLLSRLIGAHTEVITWPWLGLVFWIAAGAATCFFAICRYEARIAGHAFWPGKPIVLESGECGSRTALSTALANIGPGVRAVIDAGNCYVCVSAGWEGAFGMSPRDVQGLCITEVWPAEIAAEMAHHVDAARAGSTVLTLHVLPGANGRPDCWHCDYARVPDADLVVVGMVDVTRAEMDLTDPLSLRRVAQHRHARGTS